MRPGLAVALLVAGGCSTKLNQAVIGLATDEPASEMDRVAISVAVAPDGRRVFDTQLDLSASGGASLPGSLVVYTIGSKLPTVTVTVTGTSSAHPLQIVQTATFALLPEQTRFLRLALEARCDGLCDSQSAPATTCIEGSCWPAAVDLSRALPYADGQEYALDCGAPGFVFTVDGTPLPPPDGECAPAQLCVEGTCYQPDGAPPVAGAGQYGQGSIATVSLD